MGMYVICSFFLYFYHLITFSMEPVEKTSFIEHNLQVIPALYVTTKEEESSYISAKELTKKYNGALISHLAELSYKRSDLSAFFIAAQKRSEKCLTYLAEVAQELKATDLSNQITACKYFQHYIPSDMEYKIRDIYWPERERTTLLYTSVIRSSVVQDIAYGPREDMVEKHTDIVDSESSQERHSEENDTVDSESSQEEENSKEEIFVTFPESVFALTANSKGDFSLYEIDTGALIQQFKGASEATEEQSDDRIIQGHTHQVENVNLLIKDHETYYLSRSKDSMKLWDQKSGKCIKTIACDVSGELYDFNNSLEHDALLFVEKDKLKLWPLDVEEDVQDLVDVNNIKSIHAISAQNKVWCIDGNGKISICNYFVDPITITHLDGTAEKYSMITNDEKILITHAEKSFSIWDITEEKYKGTIAYDYNIKCVPTMYIDPSGKSIHRQLAYCPFPACAFVCDGAQSTKVHTLLLPSNVTTISEAKIVPDTSYCFIRSQDVIIMYDMHDGTALRTFPSEMYLKGMKIHANPKLPLLVCLSCSYQNDERPDTLDIFDYSTGTLIHTMPGVFDNIHAILSDEKSVSVFALHDVNKYMQKIELMNEDDMIAITKLTNPHRSLKDTLLLQKICASGLPNDNEELQQLGKEESAFLKKYYIKQ